MPVYGVSDASTDGVTTFSERYAYDWPGKRVRRLKVVWLNGSFWTPSWRLPMTLGFYFRRLRIEPGPLGLLGPFGQRWVIEARTCEAPGWPEGAVVVGKDRPDVEAPEITPKRAMAWVWEHGGADA